MKTPEASSYLPESACEKDLVLCLAGVLFDRGQRSFTFALDYFSQKQ